MSSRVPSISRNSAQSWPGGGGGAGRAERVVSVIGPESGPDRAAEQISIFSVYRQQIRSHARLTTPLRVTSVHGLHSGRPQASRPPPPPSISARKSSNSRLFTY